MAQVIQKFVEFDAVHRDQDLAYAWAENRLERESAHCLLKAIAAQMCEAFPNAMSRSRLPASWMLEPLEQPHMQRVVLNSGRAVVVNRETGTTCPVIPESADLKECLIVTHVSDRCSINCAALNFAADEGFLWSAAFGLMHDLWNSVKSGAKAATGVPRCLQSGRPPASLPHCRVSCAQSTPPPYGRVR